MSGAFGSLLFSDLGFSFIKKVGYSHFLGEDKSYKFLSNKIPTCSAILLWIGHPIRDPPSHNKMAFFV